MISNFYYNYKRLIFTENFWYKQAYNHIKVTFFNLFDLKSQGLWDSINALGALFPRFIFRPLEEGYFYFFRENPNSRRSQLPVILRLSMLLGLICVFIGIPQCFSILFLYGGKTLSDWPGELILALALINTLFCACNGMIEGSV